MYQIPTKKWNCEIRDTKGEKKIPSFPLTDMAILWKKREKSRNRSNAQGKSPEKGKKKEK